MENRKKARTKGSYVSSCRLRNARLYASSKRLYLKRTDKIDMKESKRKREMYTQRNSLACEALECSFDLSFEMYATFVQFDFCKFSNFRAFDATYAAICVMKKLIKILREKIE